MPRVHEIVSLLIPVLLVGCPKPPEMRAFEVGPRAFCSGESIHFRWDIVGIQAARLESATGQVLADGTVQDMDVVLSETDLPLDFVVKYDGQEYRASALPPANAPVYALVQRAQIVSELAIVSEDNPQWWPEANGHEVPNDPFVWNYETIGQVSKVPGQSVQTSDPGEPCCPIQCKQSLHERTRELVCTCPIGSKYTGFMKTVKVTKHFDIVTHSARRTVGVDLFGPRVQLRGVRNFAGANTAQNLTLSRTDGLFSGLARAQEVGVAASVPAGEYALTVSPTPVVVGGYDEFWEQVPGDPEACTITRTEDPHSCIDNNNHINKWCATQTLGTFRLNLICLP